MIHPASHRPALPYARDTVAATASAPAGERVSLFAALSSPVTVITKGGGVQVFNDSRRLFDYLAGIPARRDSIMSIQTPVSALTDDSICALETMLWLVGFRPKNASKRAGNPMSRFWTKYSWRYLSEYLGWEWRPLK